MAKLQVLSDSRTTDNYPLSAGGSKGGFARHLIRNRNRCCRQDDRNKNTNNININFGTNVEHSHNVDSGDDGRFVSNDIPKMQNLNVALPKQNFSLPILRPTGNNFAVEMNTVAPEYRGFRAGNKKVIVNNRRPKFVPNSSKNYYPEFP